MWKSSWNGLVDSMRSRSAHSGKFDLQSCFTLDYVCVRAGIGFHAISN